MKPQKQPSLTPKQISEYEAMNEEFIKEGTEFRIDLPPEDEYLTQIALERSRENGPKTRAHFIGNQLVFAPHPPTAEAVKCAQFVDKTYQWQGR